MPSPDSSGPEPTPATTDHNQVNRRKNACERCRTSKVRCYLDTYDTLGKCRRCYNSDKKCVFVDLPPRKPRRRTDARVKDLEKEITTMKDLFLQLQHSRDDTSAGQSHADSRSAGGSSQASLKAAESPATSISQSWTPSNVQYDIIPEYLSSSMISEERARALFLDFISISLPQHPVVAITEDFDTMKAIKPMLLLAIIAAAAGAGDAVLFSVLHTHLTRCIVDAVIINGRRNLELLQAVMVLEVWYCPPDDLRKLNFYQWIHIAGTMALQLGIVGRNDDDDESDRAPPSEEEMRAALAVYFMCSSAAMSLRRQKILEMTPQLQLTLDLFREKPMGSHDRTLAAWVDLQLLSEVAHETTLNRESSSVRELEACFESWESGLDAETLSGSLSIYYHFLRAKLYERALRPVQQPEEMIPPFLEQTERRMGIVGVGDAPVFPSTTPAQGIRSFLMGCHATLSAFLAMRPEILRFCPAVAFVRTAYAVKGVVLLMKGLLQSSEDQREKSYAQVLRLTQERLELLVRDYGAKVPRMVRGLAEILTADVPSAQISAVPEGCKLPSSASYPTPPEMPKAIEQPDDRIWEQMTFDDWNLPLDETLLQSLDFDMIDAGVFSSMETGDFDISALEGGAEHTTDSAFWNGSQLTNWSGL